MTLTWPAPPDWLAIATSPAGRRGPAIVAVEVSAKPSTKLTMPLQFGPMNRSPPARAISTMRRCAAAPSGVPVSPKPAENTVANGTPRRTQSSSAAGTAVAGSTMPTWSGACGTSASAG